MQQKNGARSLFYPNNSPSTPTRNSGYQSQYGTQPHPFLFTRKDPRHTINNSQIKDLNVPSIPNKMVLSEIRDQKLDTSTQSKSSTSNRSDVFNSLSQNILTYTMLIYIKLMILDKILLLTIRT